MSRHRGEHQFARRDVSGTDGLSRRDRHRVVGELAHPRQAGNAHACQGVGRVVGRVAETKVAHHEGVGRALHGAHAGVGTCGGFVDVGDRDAEGLQNTGTGTVGGTYLHQINIVTVCVGRRLEIGRTDEQKAVASIDREARQIGSTGDTECDQLGFRVRCSECLNQGHALRHTGSSRRGDGGWGVGRAAGHHRQAVQIVGSRVADHVQAQIRPVKEQLAGRQGSTVLLGPSHRQCDHIKGVFCDAGVGVDTVHGHQQGTGRQGYSVERGCLRQQVKPLNLVGVVAVGCNRIKTERCAFDEQLRVGGLRGGSHAGTNDRGGVDVVMNGFCRMRQHDGSSGQRCPSDRRRRLHNGQRVNVVRR